MSLNESIAIDTPEGIEHYRFSAVIAALSTEIKTGMKIGRGSIVQFCREAYGTTSRTKKGTLEEMRVLYAAKYGRESRIGRG